ncbi:MAG: hypothetical protein ACEQSX_11585 [Baekduiaceae bacterium]
MPSRATVAAAVALTASLVGASPAGAWPTPPQGDPQPPSVQNAPQSGTNDRDYSLTWTAGVGSDRVVCSVDSYDVDPDSLPACPNPITLTGLEPGIHQVMLWGHNSGQWTSPMVVRWLIMAPFGTTAVTGAPTGRCGVPVSLQPCHGRSHPLLTRPA